jgi:formate/nitrite transporter FocA (FNT family)
MERDAMALLVSHRCRAINGRISSAKGIFHVQLEGVPGGFTGKPRLHFGFIIVIMARQQLFTENTVTAVLPVMQNPHSVISVY